MAHSYELGKLAWEAFWDHWALDHKCKEDWKPRSDPNDRWDWFKLDDLVREDWQAVGDAIATHVKNQTGG